MNNLDSITKSEQKDVIASFWTMLQECEQKADENNDPILRHWVSCWYQQWNRITNDTKEPKWVARARREKEGYDRDPHD